MYVIRNGKKRARAEPMNVNPGDVFIAWDMCGRKWHAWLFLRPATDEDIKSGHSQFGYSAKNELGQYWHYYNLGDGYAGITMDNVVCGWERL